MAEMEQKIIDISIVIVNWNVQNFLRNCLRSIYAETAHVNFEVIVIDNHSSDGSVDMVIADFPLVKVIKNSFNKGFNAANNQGLAISQGKYALLLNPDTIVLDNAIEKMYRYAENHDDIVAIGPMILAGDGKTIQFECARKMITLWNEFCLQSELHLHFKKNRFCSNITMDYWDHRNSACVDVLSGSCVLIRTESLQQIGLLDEEYFMYADDLDLCYRLSPKGTIYYLAEAKIIHFGGESSKKSKSNLWIMRCESTKLFFRKHKGFMYAIFYKPIILISQFVKILLIFVTHAKQPSLSLKEKIHPSWELILWGFNLKDKLKSNKAFL